METKKEQPQKKEKKWSEMTYEERRASLPKKLNKLGEWMLSEEADKEYFVIVDEKAVLR